MSNFDSVLQDDAANAFGNPDEFGESVRYKKRDGTITTFAGAQVFRDPPVNTKGGPVVKMEVHLPRDPAGVRGPADINTGGDEIELKYRVGGAVAWYGFGLFRQDTGMWILHVK